MVLVEPDTIQGEPNRSTIERIHMPYAVGFFVVEHGHAPSLESVVKKRTLSALALDIFRGLYYDRNQWTIYIPGRNEDTFILCGYYGGHSDTYIPIGKELYFYNVNSLHPYVMKHYPMPGGKLVWKDNCEDMDLDNLFGFIEAYVLAPPDMKIPFLPYRTQKNTLIFPTGEFVDVYYSDELKYAKCIGYQVTPLCSYFFQKMDTCSPFKYFVTSLERIKAKDKDNLGWVRNPDEEDLGDDDLLGPVNHRCVKDIMASVDRNCPFRARQDHQSIQYKLNNDEDGMDGAG
ncbi:hypothetical protein BC332_13360 [Capsicum chinense]|nr:hypothetical protein BC332_13360 [Capsicum chinense]